MDILSIGYLNARIGNEGKLKDRLVEHLDHILLDIEKNPTYDRSSCDDNINQPSRRFFTLATTKYLEIAIGKTPGDSLGNFTCFNNQGTTIYFCKTWKRTDKAKWTF